MLMTKHENFIFVDYPDVVNVKQMCKILGIYKKTGYKLLKDNKIKHLKIGCKYLIPKVYILQYLKIVDDIEF